MRHPPIHGEHITLSDGVKGKITNGYYHAIVIGVFAIDLADRVGSIMFPKGSYLRREYANMHEQSPDPRLKRLAQQISVQLPADKIEALAVLGLVKALIEWENCTSGAAILPFVRLVAPEI